MKENSDHAKLAFPLAKFLEATSLERAPTSRDAFAISIFDDWLGSNRYHELSCNEAEQFRRNERHNQFCHLLRCAYTVLSIRFTDIHELGEPILREFISDTDFTAFIDAHDRDRTSERFFILAIPELGCIYEQHWDDTNILWFSSSTDIKKMEHLATEAGLHVIQFTE